MKTTEDVSAKAIKNLTASLMLGLAVRTVAAEEFETKNDIEFAVVDGVSLKLDAIMPKSKGPHPAIVYVHGGGFTGGDKKDYDRGATAPLMERGWGVISVNYRLAPKYPFPAATDDVEAGIHYIKTHATELDVDPNRLVLMGISAGGHLVSFVGVKHRPENRVAAVVPFCGEHDLVFRLQEDPCMMDGRIVPRSHGGCLSGGLSAFLNITEVTPEALAGIAREASPVTYVNKEMPPYLMVHGTRDFACPFDQALLMQEAMKKAGRECTMLAMFGAGHGSFPNTPAGREYKQKMVDWILAHVSEK